jgi:lysyl-tRNA synthetase class I
MKHLKKFESNDSQVEMLKMMAEFIMDMLIPIIERMPEEAKKMGISVSEYLEKEGINSRLSKLQDMRDSAPDRPDINVIKKRIDELMDTVERIKNMDINESKKNKGLRKKLKGLKESHSETDNYMFFANLENICSMVTDILEMDKEEIDKMLTEGHDWATDHISAAKESIEHVHDWLNSSNKDSIDVESPEQKQTIKDFSQFGE